MAWTKRGDLARRYNLELDLLMTVVFCAPSAVRLLASPVAMDAE